MAYKTLTDIQKQRFDRGCVVFNTNNQPPNRALIPTGRYVDLEKIMEHMRGEQR